MKKFGILIHGGSEDKALDIKSGNTIISITNAAYNMLRDGKNAIDVAAYAISELENSGVFNAGIGSCITDNKTIEMDAGIMDGSSMQCGAVGAINGVKNPIRAAKKVMNESTHSLMVGPKASEFAIKHNIPKFDVIPATTQLKKFKSKNHEKYGSTVGAVVLDNQQNFAAAVSTGGLQLKSSGRVGDSAIVGSGYYAKNGVGAAVATGNGDVIMRESITKASCDIMEFGMSAQETAEVVIQKLGQFNDGYGGIIMMDKNCNVGIAYSMSVMHAGYMLDGMSEPKYLR